MYIFFYGSLINLKSREQTLKTSKVVSKAKLEGYQRKMNAPYKDGYLYLNIVPRSDSVVDGVVIKISDKDLPFLELREKGSAKVDVSKQLAPKPNFPVYAYLQEDKKFPKMKILQSYINTCTNGLSEKEKTQWLKTTIIGNDVIDDTGNPIYEFPA
ncbi:MAG: gamma-glutamylcyclotransferase family protein [bacterium]|nr:gamma-glutamylcyclotransferase family protein [bacterium]